MMNEHDSFMVRNSYQEMICALQAPHILMKPKVFPDGSGWCALYGDNIQDGVCGFGDTPALACADFDACWHGLGKYKKESTDGVPK